MTRENPLIYLIAGEPSGDLLGARLMRALKGKLGEGIKFKGIGGEAMIKEGLKSSFDIKEISIMGIFEVLPKIPKVLRRIKETVKDIENSQPDCVITIDSWSFCWRINKALYKNKSGILRIHYVAPQVWAWKKGRIKKMPKVIDHLLTLLPFEKDYFEPHGIPTTFVGHPVLEGLEEGEDKENFYIKNDLSKELPIISLLPGSRHNEIKRLLPVFYEALNILRLKGLDFQVILPTVSTVKEEVAKICKDWNFSVKIIEGQNARQTAFLCSKAALAASGTVSLELAMAKVPHLIAYKINPLNYIFLPFLMLRIKFVNLINILQDKEIIPECLLWRCKSDILAEKLEVLLKDEKKANEQISQSYKSLKMLKPNVSGTPSQIAAKTILDIINYD